MDSFFLAALFATGAYMLNAQQQRKRIAFLGQYLGNYQIEKHMETLTQGYLRALGEQEPTRREQVFRLLDSTATQLSDQFSRFAADFAKADAPFTRVSRLPVSLPYAQQLLPMTMTFDVRKVIAVHAHGIARVVENSAGLSERDRAFRLSAELFLMQHTCHWFCKSKTVASARMVARHQTPHAQLVASVSPETREAYLALVGH